MHQLTVEIYRNWNEADWQTGAERPAASAAALVSWTGEPPAVDAGVPAEIRRMVAGICVALGPVAFRLFFDHDLSQSAVLVPARRTWLPLRAWRKITRTWPADIAIATKAGDVAEMFDQDWCQQGQVALVLEKNANIDEPIALLRRLRDWRARELPAGTRLLLAAAVDGDGIMLAARTETQLKAVLAELENACGKEGIPVRYKDDCGASR